MNHNFTKKLLCLLFIFIGTRAFAQSGTVILHNSITALQKEQTVELKAFIHGTGVQHKKILEGEVKVVYKKQGTLWLSKAEASIQKPMFDHPERERVVYNGKSVYAWDQEQNTYVDRGALEDKGQNYLGFNSIVWLRLLKADPFLFSEQRDTAIYQKTDTANTRLCDIVLIKRSTFNSLIFIDKETKFPVRIQNLIPTADGQGSVIFDYYAMLNQQIPDSYFTVDKTAVKEAAPGSLAVSQPSKQINLIAVGEKAPNWELTDVYGKPIGSAAFKGKIILLDFFATWCSPCKLFEEKLIEYYNLNKNKNFVVIGMDYRETMNHPGLLSYLKKKGIVYPIATNAENLSTTFMIESVPTIYVIDGNGKVIFNTSGYSASIEKQMYDVLNNHLQKL